MLEGPTQVDVRQLREPMDVREDTEVRGPEQEADPDEGVEERLDDQRRAERRVRAAFDTALEKKELEHVSAARRSDRVEAHTSEVRAEDTPPAHARAGVRGGHDVPPGTRSREQSQRLEDERDAERAEIDGREVTKEEPGVVEEDVHESLRNGRRARGRGPRRPRVPPLRARPRAARAREGRLRTRARAS